MDIAPLGGACPHVLVGASQQHSWAYVEPLQSHAAEHLQVPMLRMVADARSRGEVTTVHTNQEPGLLALEETLLTAGLSTTQGYDPQFNGLADQTVGQLCKMARATLAHHEHFVATSP